MAGFTDLTKEEMLAVAGEAATVMDADRLAWEALESVLGPDPIDAWTLVKMKHAIKERGKLSWEALFQRDPDVPSPPNIITDAAKITDASALPAQSEPASDPEDALES